MPNLRIMEIDVDRLPWDEIDPHTHARYLAMKAKYALDAPAKGDVA